MKVHETDARIKIQTHTSRSSENLVNPPKDLIPVLKPSIICVKSTPKLPPSGISQPELDRINKEVFKNSCFRPLQLEIIESVLSKQDTFVCMPTGGGKSLTFQLPSYLTSGLSIVIMPLISLIQDQVYHLENLSISSKVISGKQTKNNEKTAYYQILTDLSIKIVFVTPEKLSKSAEFIELLDSLYSQSKIARFVIDEAHCVSTWGREFRADYLKLSSLKTKYPSVPILALTGTATEKVRKDVVSVLKMKKTQFFQGSFNRINLYYEVKYKNKTVLDDIGLYISTKKINQTGIIYCLSRKDCEKVANYLKSTYKINCEFYHADLPSEKRRITQENWMHGSTKVLTATIAFGMGINKPNVRFVIHYSFPKSLENFYQESGRAGRDNLSSDCIIYFNHSDKYKHDNLISNKRQSNNFQELYTVMKFCEDIYTCRRKTLLEYFGEKFDGECNEMCDNCLNKRKGNLKDYTSQALQIIKLVERLPSGISTLIQISGYLKGTNGKKNIITKEGFGILNDMRVEDIERVMRHMIYENILAENLKNNKKKFKMTRIELGPNSAQLKDGKIQIKLITEISKYPTVIPVTKFKSDLNSDNSQLSNSIPITPNIKINLEKNAIQDITNIINDSLSQTLRKSTKNLQIQSQGSINIKNNQQKPILNKNKTDYFIKPAYDKSKNHENFEELLLRLELVRKKLARDRNTTLQDVLSDEKLSRLAQDMNGDADKDFLNEIKYFKEVYKIKDMLKFDLDLNTIDISSIPYIKDYINPIKKLKSSN